MSRYFKTPSAFIKSISKTNEEQVEFDNYYWTVGKVSNQANYPIDINDLIYYYPVVIKYLNFKTEKLAISLPSEIYRLGKNNKIELVKKLEKTIKDCCGISVSAYPQGITGLQKIFDDKSLSPDANYTLVIDGGFNTINTSIVDKKMQVVYVKTYFNEFGIRNLLEVFAEEIKSKIPELTSNIQQLKNMFLKGYHTEGLTTRYDFSEIKEKVSSMFADRIFNRINKDLKSEGYEIDQFCLIGGLAYYISFDSDIPHFIAKNRAEYYNVTGMAKMSGLNSIDFGFGDIKVFSL